MTNEERKVKLIDSAMASATRLAVERCLKAIDDEPESMGNVLANHYLYKTIVQQVKANIRTRILAGAKEQE